MVSRPVYQPCNATADHVGKSGQQDACGAKLSVMVDPFSAAIVTALAWGAVEAAKAVVAQAAVDAYQALKQAIVSDDSKAVPLVAAVESSPDSMLARTALARRLSEVGPSDLVWQAHDTLNDMMCGRVEVRVAVAVKAVVMPAKRSPSVAAQPHAIRSHLPVDSVQPRLDTAKQHELAHRLELEVYRQLRIRVPSIESQPQPAAIERRLKSRR
ncbi:MAG: hypothetical protein RL701_1495 [Pseudomonadota bacterium]